MPPSWAASARAASSARGRTAEAAACGSGTLTSWLTSGPGQAQKPAPGGSAPPPACLSTLEVSSSSEQAAQARSEQMTQADKARSVWAGINRAALSMGCSNYGQLNLQSGGKGVWAGAKQGGVEQAETCLERTFKRPVPVPVGSEAGSTAKKAPPSGWRKVTTADGSKKVTRVAGAVAR